MTALASRLPGEEDGQNRRPALPKRVVDRARKLLEMLKTDGAPAPVVTKLPEEEEDQITMLDLRSQQVCQVLEQLNVETLTPIEAMNELYKLKKMIQ